MAEVKGKECLDLAGAMTRLQKQNSRAQDCISVKILSEAL